MRIVDAHHHIWRLSHTPWLQGPPVPRIFGEYGSLRRDYSISEFAADVRPHGVDGSVYVQVNVAPGTEADEVAWAGSQGAQDGLVQAVVGFCDLARDDVDEALESLAVAGPLRGIRQQLHWHVRPEYRFASRPDLMLDEDWQRGLAAVQRRGLPFELQVFPGQFPDALQAIRRFGDTTFVLLHAGMLEDRSPEGWAAWRKGLADLAAEPNVVVKLSGLGTFVRSCSVPLWAPVVRYTVDTFGPRRCMFGSNFPIEKLWTDYQTLLEVMTECLEPYNGSERAAILSGTADRTYLAPAEVGPASTRSTANS